MRKALTPLTLGEALTSRASVPKTMRVTLDSGDDHALLPTEASGEASFGLPQTEVFGSIYAASLEEVDSTYELSVD